LTIPVGAPTSLLELLRKILKAFVDKKFYRDSPAAISEKSAMVENSRSKV